MDQIAREVTEAQARVRTRRNRIAVPQAGIQSARGSYDRNFSRIREGQGLPIEVLQAIQSLDATQRELVDATVDFNVRKFQLQRRSAAREVIACNRPDQRRFDRKAGTKRQDHARQAVGLRAADRE